MSSPHHDTGTPYGPTPIGRVSPNGAYLPVPVFDMSSDEPLPDLPDAAHAEISPAATHLSPADPILRSQDGSMWLDGSVLMCPCPDCRAPMTVRIWLLIADCWKCGVSIELSEQQEREARRLLEQAAAKRRSTPANGARQQHAGAPREASPRPATPQQESPQPTEQPASPALRAPAPPPPPSSSTDTPARNERPQRRAREAARRPSRRQNRSAASIWLNQLFGDTPAWLISLVFHLVLLTLLGLLHLPGDNDERLITLSTAVSRVVRKGGEKIIVEPQDEIAFDLPIPPDIKDRVQREVLIRADQDARELRLNPDAPSPNLPELRVVKDQLSQSGDIRRALAARDPRIRVEMVKREGGTTLTEAAVARGLRWLGRHQSSEGHWSLDRFNHGPGCTCGGRGLRSDAAGTSLALMPFLGAGQTHLVGKYRDTVARGLRWLVQNQLEDGDLRAGSVGNSGMYAHGQGAIVLCEAFAMTGDEQLRAPAQKAIDFIVAGQHPAGGWRYRPGQAGDTSVVGWQLMALQSARAANLTTPDETFLLADQFLDLVQSNGGAQYAYQPGHRPTPAMTAEALLCRMYLGWKKDDPGLVEGSQWLIDQNLPSVGNPNIYYWYYGTQTMHHAGGPAWDRWNSAMRDILTSTQEKRGHEAGSWDPRGSHSSSGGRIYMTALAVCTLEVYYRHLPIFRQIDLDAE